MEMDPERWQRIEELFRTVAERPEAEREAYLARACDDDEQLLHEVLSLLASDTREDFIQTSISNVARSLAYDPNDDISGVRIGPYRLERMIGRGGMGAVYEAVRDDDHFQQKVALKLIRRGMDSDFVRGRFLRERQILASLDHPNIARLFDGGAMMDGRPYFVMEYVDGMPITDYCSNRFSINDKLQLFRDICSAVQHAHSKLVIHRDLKPSNILITPEGAPKLLDFGIAKLLAPDSGEPLTRTATSVRLMTPDYASPEQARGQNVATTTDVYSLGVVLYELLTGRRPYEFKSYSPVEIERTICEVEAEAPSRAVSSMDGAPGKLARRLEGDLDNIVLMALRKEPSRRYQSVEQFSEDIRRHLAGLPVLARKDTFGYRAGKFVRRHKAGVAVVAMLAIFAVALAVLAVRLARERDRANLEAATAQATTQSLVSVLEFADPGKSQGNPITARELLDQGAEKVVRDLKSQPAVQAKLLDTLGGLYQAIGVYDRAQSLFEEALRMRRQLNGNEHGDVAESLHRMAVLANLRGDYAGSERLFREALAMRRRLFGNSHADAADSMDGLGNVLIVRGMLDEAEPLLREALALRRTILGSEHKDLAESINSLGRLLGEQGKFAEAEAQYRQALDLHRKLYGPEHPLVATGLNNVAAMLQEQEHIDEAVTLFREALALRRKLFGPEHPEVVISIANLALALQDKREYDEAERHYREALELRRKLLGPDHPNLTITMNNLATLLRLKGDYRQAELLFQQTLAMRRRLLGETHPETATSMSNLAGVYFDKGDYNEAERMYRQVLDVYLKSLQPDHWMINRTRSLIGGCLIRLKRFREAEEQLLIAHAGLKVSHGDLHTATRRTVSRLLELYQAWDKPEQAAQWRDLPKYPQ
ncbi:MAG: serine/threonine protein kinase [Acidobacteria bacterium]|nr:serine/threonine protein kinase [Acidobacteriota bacterium]MCW5966889.1 serine/threonine protein kinase [Blastocatellales bacterium]